MENGWWKLTSKKIFVFEKLKIIAYNTNFIKIYITSDNNNTIQSNTMNENKFNNYLIIII